MAQIDIEVRTRYTVKREKLHLFLPDGHPMAFEAEGMYRLLLRAPASHEMSEPLSPDSMVCEVRAATTVSTSRKNMLDQIAAGKMPDGSGPDPTSYYPDLEKEEYESMVDEAGNLRDGALPALKHLPPTLKQFVVDKSKLLYQVAEYSLRALRWRAGATGGPQILELNEYFEWSDDGEAWHSIWNGWSVHIDGYASSPVCSEYREFVEQRMGNNDTEPLWHELYREADDLRERNPRSALLTLVTAAEVAVKRSIAAVVPDAGSLIEDTQSPDIVALIEENSLSLQAASPRQDYEIMPPPESVIKELRAAIQARNLVAHQGKPPPGPESLDRKFRAVRDLLWLLDCCLGQAWAPRFVSHRLQSRPT